MKAMKSIIIYYSYSGNTKKVAKILADRLREKGEVQSMELSCRDELRTFFAQSRAAFFHKQPEILPVNLDLSGYDLVCFGTPVWAFAPAPAINTYLEKCFGLRQKEAILFTTYGSGTGNTRCLNYMQGILSQKGAQSFKRFSIQQFKVGDQDFVLLEIQKIKV